MSQFLQFLARVLHRRVPLALLGALALALVHLPAVGVAGADFRVGDLEREVRELRQQSRAQSQRIDALEQQIARAATDALAAEDPEEPVGTDALPQWVDRGAWERIEPGMAELDVVKHLGPPTSVREHRSGERILHYALEFDSNAFLAGHVELSNGRVAAVQMPRLR
jgi:hypothetical protein